MMMMMMMMISGVSGAAAPGHWGAGFNLHNFEQLKLQWNTDNTGSRPGRSIRKNRQRA